MEAVPKWFKPVAIAALVWNLLGCAAYLADVMMSDEAISALSSAERAIRNSRPLWVVSATAIAVWVGALGSIGLVMRRAWSKPDLIVSEFVNDAGLTPAQVEERYGRLLADFRRIGRQHAKNVRIKPQAADSQRRHQHPESQQSHPHRAPRHATRLVW